jgi:HEAT repeat protein
MSAGPEHLSLDHLIALLQDDDPLVRVHAGFLLGALGEEALPAVPILLEMLQYGELQDRKLAATTLGEIGPSAEEAVPFLLELTNDEDDGLADLATWALEEIDIADTDAEAA